MKPVLLLASAAVALAAAPALADGFLDYAAQERAYSNSINLQRAGQCFHGKAIAGVNRAGDKTLYVQSKQGGIYRLSLPDGCAALDDAQKIAVRADGGDAVCVHGWAQVVVQTSAGARQCRVADVRALNGREVAALSSAPRRQAR